jgi:hypothetical protein
MGVDVKIYLSPRVCHGDVAAVIGKLAGNESYMDNIPAVHVNDVEVQNAYDIVGIVEIIFPSKIGMHVGLENMKHSVLWHWDSSDWHKKNHSFVLRMLPRSTPFWCAVAKRVVEIFGGVVVYNDCAHNELWADLYNPRVPSWVNAGGGSLWLKRQTVIHEVQPLTMEDLYAIEHEASYGPEIRSEVQAESK